MSSIDYLAAWQDSWLSPKRSFAHRAHLVRTEMTQIFAILSGLRTTRSKFASGVQTLRMMFKKLGNCLFLSIMVLDVLNSYQTASKFVLQPNTTRIVLSLHSRPNHHSPTFLMALVIWMMEMCSIHDLNTLGNRESDSASGKLSRRRTEHGEKAKRRQEDEIVCLK